MLRAKKPEAIIKRLKMFLFGPAGVGKTVAAISFPSAYIIDTERGAEEYSETIARNGGVLYQESDPDEIVKEIKSLMSEKHQYKTLVIDPITCLYEAIKEKWAKKFTKQALDKGKESTAEMQDFGPLYWTRVKTEHKNILRLISRLDMNVIITSHQKDLYADGAGSNLKKIGVTFDSDKKDEYFFDLVFRLENRNGVRTAIKIKERAEINAARFPVEFDWLYDNLRKFYGDSLDKEAAPIIFASKEQVTKLQDLCNNLRLPDEEIEKWLNKANAADFSDMTTEQVQKCIDFCQKKIDAMKG